jgi:anti-sigma regulatory factor (Ser/Thr protein kinase)
VQGETFLDAVPESVPQARALVRAAAAEHGIEGEPAWALMLATTEAMSNAVEHGRGQRIGLLIEPNGNELSVEIQSRGPFLAGLPDPSALKRGHGLPLIAEVVDRLHLEPGAEQTRIRFAKSAA